MRATLIFFIVAAICTLIYPASAQDTSKPQSTAEPSLSLSDNLVGAWRLVSIETRRANGEVIYPFYGKHPEGLLIYDRSGWMSVQIVSDPKPMVPVASSREAFLKASPGENQRLL
jgi:hypothetical protein